METKADLEEISHEEDMRWLQFREENIFLNEDLVHYFHEELKAQKDDTSDSPKEEKKVNQKTWIFHSVVI